MSLPYRTPINPPSATASGPESAGGSDVKPASTAGTVNQAAAAQTSRKMNPIIAFLFTRSHLTIHVRKRGFGGRFFSWIICSHYRYVKLKCLGDHSRGDPE